MSAKEQLQGESSTRDEQGHYGHHPEEGKALVGTLKIVGLAAGLLMGDFQARGAELPQRPGLTPDQPGHCNKLDSETSDVQGSARVGHWSASQRPTRALPRPRRC